MVEEKILLNVAETYHSDIGRGIVRIDSAQMQNIGVSENDYVLLKGKSETIARVARASMEDSGLEIVRMDSAIRNNV